MKLFDRTLTGLHANLIVGKKWDDEKQDWNYILRNTYGDRCSELHKKKGQISESEMLKVRACQRKKNCLPQEAGGEYEDYYRNAHFAGCQSDCMKTLARGNYQTCRKKCENERITLYTECKATCYPMRNQNLQCEKGYLTVSGPELRRYLMSIAYVD